MRGSILVGSRLANARQIGCKVRDTSCCEPSAAARGYLARNMPSYPRRRVPRREKPQCLGSRLRGNDVTAKIVGKVKRGKSVGRGHLLDLRQDEAHSRLLHVLATGGYHRASTVLATGAYHRASTVLAKVATNAIFERFVPTLASRLIQGCRNLECELFPKPWHP